MQRALLVGEDGERANQLAVPPFRSIIYLARAIVAPRLSPVWKAWGSSLTPNKPMILNIVGSTRIEDMRMNEYRQNACAPASGSIPPLFGMARSALISRSSARQRRLIEKTQISSVRS